MKQRLDAVLAALKADRGAGAEPQQPLLAELQKDVKDLSDLLDDKRHEGRQHEAAHRGSAKETRSVAPEETGLVPSPLDGW